jgi:hypothetical protein
MKKYLFIIGCLTAMMMSGCKVEFSPNAEWKNVPVVYCILDQDDDTTWVRVQRCYLSEGNIYQYGSYSDSINYPQGSISVALLAYQDGTLKDSIAFSYTERDRDSGSFAYSAQPLYFALTKNKLNENYTFALSIRSTADGSLLAYTDPISLIKKTSGTLISKPSITVMPSGDTLGGFYFNDGDPTSGAACNIQWNPLLNARLYQPIVRFYYESGGITHHVDLLCSRVSSSNTEVRYPRSQFLSDLKEKLKDDTSVKHYIPHVDIYLTCCTEELNAYLSTTSSGSSINQEHEAFSNIIGGVGVFAARRTHLYKGMPSDNSNQPGVGLHDLLINLGVGFEAY